MNKLPTFRKKSTLIIGRKTKCLYIWTKLVQIMILQTFGEIIKAFREEMNLPLRVVAKEVGIDTSTLGKLEKNERNPSKDLIRKFSNYYKVDERDLLIASKSDSVAYKLMEDDNAIEILKAAEEKVKYITKNKNQAL
ncbi:MAG: helix-turn-helix transcriptional regulator [Bacteroidota bacterium]